MFPGLADEHIKSAIVTVQECGLSGQDDDALLNQAASEGRLLLTNNTDFLRIHADWLAGGKEHAGIVYWPQEKYSIGESIRRVLQYSRNTSPQDARNHLKYL